MPLNPIDPTWSGSGTRAAWVEFKPYRIHWLLGASGVDASDAVLDIQPFPVDYHPAKSVATGGNGKTIRVGWATAQWHFAALPAPHMQQLFTARDNANTLNAGFVYIVTATDTLSLQLDTVSGWQTTRPLYSKFSAAIWDITWEERGSYTYSNVVVEFRHLKLV